MEATHRMIMRPAVILLLLCLIPAAQAAEKLILPEPALLRGQQTLRRAEQDGAAVMMPGAVLEVQQKINAAWTAYHRQVDEEADDPEDEEAVLARRLALEAELDAELLLATLRTEREEARLDALRGSAGGAR